MLFRKRVRVTIEEVRDMFPVRAPHVEWTQSGDEIRLTVNRSPGYLASFLSALFTMPMKKNFTLDRLGAHIWRCCDGATPVGKIVSAFSESQGMPEKRVEKAVLQFLGMLSGRRLVGFQTSPGGIPPSRAR